MDTLTDLLVILFYLSALYTALGLLAAATAGIDRLGAWRPRRPSTQRRPNRRRRIGRIERGETRRAISAAKVQLQALGAA